MKKLYYLTLTHFNSSFIFISYVLLYYTNCFFVHSFSLLFDIYIQTKNKIYIEKLYKHQLTLTVLYT